MGTSQDPNRDIDKFAIASVALIFAEDKDFEVAQLVPDVMGLDRKIDLYENNHPDVAIFAQIKGRGKQTRNHTPTPLVGKDGFVNQRMEIEHLESYLKLPNPCFLIVFDVEARMGYWLFIQEYLHNLPNDWMKPLLRYRQKLIKNQPKITVKVPSNNLLADMTKLKEAIRGASGYMASAHSDRGYRYEVGKFKNMDKSFNVNLTIENGIQHFRFEKINGAVPFTMANAEGEIFERFINQGLPVTLKPNEINFPGSPIPEKAFQEISSKGGTVQFSRSSPAIIDILRKNGSDEVVGGFRMVPCKIQSGLKVARVSASTPLNLISIQFSCDVRTNAVEDFSIEADLSEWSTSKLMDLPYFANVEKLLHNFVQTDYITFDLYRIGGEHAIGCRADVWGTKFFNIAPKFEWLRRARKVASYFRQNPTLPDPIPKTLADDVNRVYNLITDGHCRMPLQIEMLIDFRTVVLREILQDSPSRLVNISGIADYSVELFGEVIRLGNLKGTMSEALIEFDEEQFRLLHDDSTIKVKVIPTSRSEQIFERDSEGKEKTF